MQYYNRNSKWLSFSQFESGQPQNLMGSS